MLFIIHIYNLDVRHFLQVTKKFNSTPALFMKLRYEIVTNAVDKRVLVRKKNVCLQSN